MDRSLYYENRSDETVIWKKGKSISDEHNNVYKFTNFSTNLIYAGKILNFDRATDMKKKRILDEINIHKTIKHKNILPYVTSFFDGGNYILITELCDTKNLSEIPLTTDMMPKYLYEISKGMKYLYDNSVLHGDLKLQNLLIDLNGNMRIADFGYSTKIKTNQNSEGENKIAVCGTPNYMAPELINCVLKSETYYSPQNTSTILDIDKWAFGVVIFAVSTGERPFETQKYMDTWIKITKVDYVLPNNIFAPIIKNLLVLEPEKRSSWEDAIAFLINI